MPITQARVIAIIQAANAFEQAYQDIRRAAKFHLEEVNAGRLTLADAVASSLAVCQLTDSNLIEHAKVIAAEARHFRDMARHNERRRQYMANLRLKRTLAANAQRRAAEAKTPEAQPQAPEARPTYELAKYEPGHPSHMAQPSEAPVIAPRYEAPPPAPRLTPPSAQVARSIANAQAHEYVVNGQRISFESVGTEASGLDEALDLEALLGPPPNAPEAKP